MYRQANFYFEAAVCLALFSPPLPPTFTLPLPLPFSLSPPPFQAFSSLGKEEKVCGQLWKRVVDNTYIRTHTHAHGCLSACMYVYLSVRQTVRAFTQRNSGARLTVGVRPRPPRHGVRASKSSQTVYLKKRKNNQRAANNRIRAAYSKRAKSVSKLFSVELKKLVGVHGHRRGRRWRSGARRRNAAGPRGARERMRGRPEWRGK